MYKLRARGFATAVLEVYPGFVLALPYRIGAWEGCQPIRYDWPVAVIEYIVWSRRLRMPNSAGLLVDIEGHLGRVAVRGGTRGRLRDALRGAGFDVVETTHRGWEMPKPITREELGERRDMVPRGVLSWV